MGGWEVVQSAGEPVQPAGWIIIADVLVENTLLAPRYRAQIHTKSLKANSNVPLEFPQPLMYITP